MKKKLLIAVSVVALLVAAMAVGICAHQLLSDYDILAINGGAVRIYGYLEFSEDGYATTTDKHDYREENVSSQKISSQGVLSISARVLHSPGVTCSTIGADNVYAYGDVAASTHEATSSVDEVYFLVQ